MKTAVFMPGYQPSAVRRSSSLRTLVLQARKRTDFTVSHLAPCGQPVNPSNAILRRGTGQYGIPYGTLRVPIVRNFSLALSNPTVKQRIFLISIATPFNLGATSLLQGPAQHARLGRMKFIHVDLHFPHVCAFDGFIRRRRVRA